MAPVIFHHSRPALCGSSGRAWAADKAWSGVPEPNRCKRCSSLADKVSIMSIEPPATVTITDAERVIWTGPYADFQRENMDALSVAEFCELERTGTLTIGGGSAPLLNIACDSRPRPVEIEHRQPSQGSE